jgi:chitin disaccharide deacetylase
MRRNDDLGTHGMPAATNDGAAMTPPQASTRRRIWLCADDYGISPAVSAAIRDLIVRNRLNATSVMVATPTFQRSEEQAKTLSTLEPGEQRTAIGLHVTLTAPFRPLSTRYLPLDHGAFPAIGRMIKLGFLGRLDRKTLTDEVAAQFKAFVAAFGQPPDFVDGHQHVQLVPQVSEAVLDVMKDYAPNAWVRQCGRRLRLARLLSDRKGLVLDILSRRFRRIAAAYGVSTNPAFAGTYDFDGDERYADLFPAFLDGLPDGGLIMCHPGLVDAELARLDPLTARREQEFAYLMGDTFPALMASEGATLVV